MGIEERICPRCMCFMHPHELTGWLKCDCGFCKKENTSMITRVEILMGRDKDYPLTPTLSINLSKLMEAVNKLRTLYGKPMYVSSGYRPGKYNAAAGGSKNSAHITCEAVDFKDIDGKLKEFCTEGVLEHCGLYMEDPSKTKTWCHLQIRPTKNRIFIP